MVVERGAALVETPCVPGLTKPEPLVIEVVAKLMTNGTQKRTKRGDLLSDRRPHPDPHKLRLGSVVPKQFRRPTPVSDPEWAGRQDADGRGLDSIEAGRRG